MPAGGVRANHPFPIRTTVKRKATRQIWTDPRQEGEPLWPERFSLEALQRMAKDEGMSSHMAAGHYQQRPTAREGGLLFAASRRTTEAPPRQWSRRDRISERPWRSKLTSSTAPTAAERQSFLDDLPPDRATFDRTSGAGSDSPSRHFPCAHAIHPRLQLGEPDRDRFDSDCVPGTQFESSQPHHAVARSRRFPEQASNARNWRASSCGESLCERPAESQGRFRGFVSGPEICVSRKPETWFAETHGAWFGDEPSPLA